MSISRDMDTAPKTFSHSASTALSAPNVSHEPVTGVDPEGSQEKVAVSAVGSRARFLEVASEAASFGTSKLKQPASRSIDSMDESSPREIISDAPAFCPSPNVISPSFDTDTNTKGGPPLSLRPQRGHQWRSCRGFRVFQDCGRYTPGAARKIARPSREAGSGSHKSAGGDHREKGPLSDVVTTEKATSPAPSDVTASAQCALRPLDSGDVQTTKAQDSNTSWENDFAVASQASTTVRQPNLSRNPVHSLDFNKAVPVVGPFCYDVEFTMQLQ